ncbi:CDP-diacylglycerol--glycerol-3-phosphate 3-phosphatidyltransferase [Candidatus Kinetoplastibacterium sorsogonicusi]|uniref:CDP-diacylglycerol--glycerol-3-phosphate 3-phosphatidyltransferase n=1 Tax=Candidatus Kinetoplastidibacterium kentomonadis TaxID=1576550 RepID=A0A3Q8F6C9_9PROT|nr:CDP-diacylglycerol--glycerol-3-phosphate 3-phosphatidyltransferase [Candidatus Kinetoplastibacterium sorsogonicusi]AWD32310.1 CDP-diacylglycerol--glycerol-3-phosphate 3-phosphatidyltransferase [Candidatus Kinetoplastibacterium sorsogonicusi]
MYYHKTFFNIPIILTWLRIAMLPIICSIYYMPISSIDRDILASCAFIIASLTDWLDGWLARLLKQTSLFGEFLDPVADKLIVCSSLIILLNLERVDQFVVLIIIGREIIISSLREWMAKIGSQSITTVHKLGKIKTVFQMFAIAFLFYNKVFFGFDTIKIGTFLIIISTFLTILSMLYYIKKVWLVMNGK